MNRFSTFILLAALAFTAAGFLTSRPDGTDREQILQTLLSVQKAISSRSVSGVLRHISDKYQGEGGKKDELRLLLLNAFHESREIQAYLDSPEISVDGDKATVSTTGHVRLITAGGSISRFSSPATLQMKREETKHWFIFPTKRWQISSARLKTATESFY